MENTVSNMKHIVTMIDNIIRYKYDIKMKIRDEKHDHQISFNSTNNALELMLQERYECAVKFRELPYDLEYAKNDIIQIIELINTDIKTILGI